ncbi:TPA: hypothetical protein NIG88_003086 [Pseudomonas aeruginosa]|nr:hypothetical protein [Pseudomonas aeruginosa]
MRESEASAGEFPLVFDGLGVFRGHFYRVIDFPNPRQNCHRTTVGHRALLGDAAEQRGEQGQIQQDQAQPAQQAGRQAGVGTAEVRSGVQGQAEQAEEGRQVDQRTASAQGVHPGQHQQQEAAEHPWLGARRQAEDRREQHGGKEQQAETVTQQQGVQGGLLASSNRPAWARTRLPVYWPWVGSNNFCTTEKSRSA